MARARVTHTLAYAHALADARMQEAQTKAYGYTLACTHSASSFL